LFSSTGRLIPKGPPARPAPDRVTVGSFGFATPGKGFEALVALAQETFDDCCIRLHLPSSDFCDADGALARDLAGRCRSLLPKRGVDFVIDHGFCDREHPIEFLGGISFTVFLYEPQDGRGISSAVDFALAARRPIALRRTGMFRHLFGVTPSVFVEDNPLP